MIPYGRQEITDADIEAVVEVLRSDFLTQGPVVPQFEDAVAKYVGCQHAVAANSATSALHIACKALGMGPGDWLWTSPITFVATANCALYCGAKVDFVDIDPRTYNLCPDALEEKLIEAEKNGKLPKVVIPVHLTGQPCDMASIHALSERFGFRIIEDASHAIGGKYRGERIGNCVYSDITVFSFHPVKIITTAEGGMAVTNSEELSEKMARLRSHGITRNPDLMTKSPDGPWYYQQLDLGYNYRLTDLQAALGFSQLARLDQYISKRHEISENYSELLAGLPVTTPWQHPDSYSAYHLYVIRLHKEQATKNHLQLFQELRSRNILVNVHYIPVHLQPYYQALGFRQGSFPNAESYYQEALSLPMFPTLTDEEQNYVSRSLAKVLRS